MIPKKLTSEIWSSQLFVLMIGIPTNLQGYSIRMKQICSDDVLFLMKVMQSKRMYHYHVNRCVVLDVMRCKYAPRDYLWYQVVFQSEWNRYGCTV